MNSEVEDVDYHWGPHPEWEYLTKHIGTRLECSGPDCGVDDWVITDE